MNSTLLGQTKGSDTIVFLYDEKGNKYGFDYNGTKYYYIFNVQGDVIGILNQSGSQIVSYQYDPWGRVLSVDGSEASTIGQFNPIRYRSYYYDTEPGFYYLQSRYYDPTTRRFLNVDSQLAGTAQVQGYNLFAYCLNNPIMMIDSTGNWPKWVDGVLTVLSGAGQVIAGAALGAAASWTGVGAVAGALLIANGLGTILSSGFEIFFEKSPKCIAVRKVNQATSASCKAIASLAIRAFTSSSCVCFASSAGIALTTKIVPPILSTKPVFIFSTVITSLRKNRGVRFRTPRYQPKKDYSFS